MKLPSIVTPSSQVDSTLPIYIYENYERFVEFMKSAAESEERLGFGQDLLQHLLTYRDFDTYKNPIVKFNYLTNPYNERDESVFKDDRIITTATDTAVLGNLQNSGTYGQDLTYILAQLEQNYLKLNDTYGFPDENGVILIDDEIILYRKKEGNFLLDLKRGASGTYILPTFTSAGEYASTEPAVHLAGAKVYNLSVLFMAAMLDTIHKSFTPDISSSRVVPEVNRSILLSQIQDFYRAKGSKLGIKALFKFLFAENDVEVEYPGDRMIVPSKSTWNESKLLRVVQVPDTFCNTREDNVTPAKLINSELVFKSYLDDKVYAKMICDYVSSYPYEDEVQYEMYIQKDDIKGDIVANPNTILTRDINRYGSIDDRRDVFTITVESTLGFPDKGVIFVEDEAITYTDKTFNQFLGCTRGYIGVTTKHKKGTAVFGPYYVEGRYFEDGEEKVSRSWPLGLVSDVDIVDPGLLHTVDDEVFVNGPGRIDPREPIMESFIENYDDDLASQVESDESIGFIGNFTAGVDGIYFDHKHVFASSSNLPYYDLGLFGTDEEVALNLRGVDQIHVLPRREEIQPNTMFKYKGTNRIGTFVDGVSAFSNVSPERIYTGKIVKFTIVDEGYGYVNPTLVVNILESEAEIEVKDGKIDSIQEIEPDNHTNVVNARISSGEDGEIELTFDLYGRVTSATVTKVGKYYKDVPNISVVDASNRGKGALLKCTVTETGNLYDVEIVYPGIDYNPETTKAEVIPIGAEAIIAATVQYYEFDRVYQVENTEEWEFDSGNGFVYENTSKVRTDFGYVGNPTDVRDRLGDDGEKHSPLIGWAYDGNPIYGPFGYKNRTDDSEGIQQYFTGYVLRDDRSEVIGGGGDEVGTLPPSEGEYPMGTFVQDYEYDIDKAVLRRYLLNSEEPERLLEEGGKNLALKKPALNKDQVLDEFNGMYCNTPEFPKELYPGGVYCYFVSVDFDDSMMFPYIIGPTFKNRPISQNIIVKSSEQLLPIVMDNIYDPNQWYDDTRLEFDFKLVERFRNAYLQENRDQVILKIGEISKGGVSEVRVEDGRPHTSEVGDYVYFDNTGTMGNGAEAKVSHVEGSPVENAYGRDIKTCVVSHVQRIDLQWTRPGETYLFVVDQLITTSSGAEGYVIAFDYDKQLVDIRVRTPNLIQEGDILYDVKGRVVNVGYITDPSQNYYNQRENNQFFYYHLQTEDGLYNLQLADSFDTLDVDRALPLPPAASRQSRLYASFCEPWNDEQQVGDLWWSHKNGRLYVWYDDGDSMQWVCTQPLGMIPMDGASDTGIGTTTETSDFTDHYSSENTVTISRKAPSMRTDGTRNRYGDLWWSSHTGILYIWNDGLCGGCGTIALDQVETLGEWVCTDPNAKVPTVGASKKSQFYRSTRNTKTFPINSTVSNRAPKDAEEGMLWWCPGTAKHYIYYDGQWVINNPVGMVPTKYAMDHIIEGGGNSEGVGPIIPLPETEVVEGISNLWFRDLKYFVPDDDIQFRFGAPGTGLYEDAILDAILRLGPPDKGRVLRGEDPLPVPDGTATFDETRSLYIIETSEPHGLRPGDLVKIENSLYDEVNDTHEIIDAGYVEPAKGVAHVKGGEVIMVEITDPGKYYTKDFYVYFSGGGGVGALGFAEVQPLAEGGGVTKVTILDGGFNYNTPPRIIFGTELTNTFMIFYMSETYGRDPYITYSTPTEGIQGNVKYVKVTSPGQGYEALPVCTGLVKKYSDRAETKITLNGGEITDVEVISTGRRYYNPEAIFVDATNSGSGAEAEVTIENGVVDSITVTNPGEGYVEPFLYLVETVGKLYALTEDIGKIKSFRIMNPGRDISPDLSLKPELQITTRLILTAPKGYFLPGQEVWQGTETNKQVTGIVDFFDPTEYIRVISTEDKTEAIVNNNDDPDIDESGILADRSIFGDMDRQMVTLIRVKGNLKDGEMLYGPTGEGMVVLEGQSDSRVVVDGISSPEGRFIDDTSKVSESYPVIQDSYYYQWFSYSIRSSLQQVEFKNFVNDIIHPAGFIMFSDVTVSDSVKSTVNVSDVNVIGYEPPVPIDPEFPPIPTPPVEDLELDVTIFPRESVNVGDVIRAVIEATGGVQPYVTTYQWQQDLGTITSWTDFPGATESTFAIPENRTGWQFRCIVEITDQEGNSIRQISLSTSPAKSSSLSTINN